MNLGKLIRRDALDGPTHALRIEQRFHIKKIIECRSRKTADDGAAIGD